LRRPTRNFMELSTVIQHPSWSNGTTILNNREG
jgi:hypothetical protein